jgi:hypothetical protein
MPNIKLFLFKLDNYKKKLKKQEHPLPKGKTIIIQESFSNLTVQP